VFQFQEIKRRKIEETGSRKREITLLDYEATNRPAGVRKKQTSPHPLLFSLRAGSNSFGWAWEVSTSQ
jgi:hypothetical protein